MEYSFYPIRPQIEIAENINFYVSTIMLAYAGLFYPDINKQKLNKPKSNKINIRIPSCRMQQRIIKSQLLVQALVD